MNRTLPHHRPRTSPWLALALTLALLALTAAGCAPKPRTAGGALDTPDHHTLRGNDMIDAGDWAGAGLLPRAGRTHRLQPARGEQLLPARAGAEPRQDQGSGHGAGRGAEGDPRPAGLALRQDRGLPRAREPRGHG